MSGDESFLARWSRRKRGAATRSDAEEQLPASAPGTVKSGPPTPLPSIEAIEFASDIKAFLAPDVPLELTRTVLRRAWRGDPAIRDFIGLSENAWDFNARGGVPGFGSLGPEEVRRLVTQLLDEPREADPTSATAPVEDGPATLTEAGMPTSAMQSPKSIAAAQHKNEQSEARDGRPRRHHGGAQPQ
jgi:Protein of unknown function (DUF3306)